MLSFLLLLSLFGCYSSQSNSCGWAVINDDLEPLQICQQERAADRSITSFMTECNREKNQLHIKWWRNSAQCNSDIEPSIITDPVSYNFNCNDTQCISLSYVTYKTYLTNECFTSSTTTINNNDVISDEPIANYNNNAPYRETSLITNNCYNTTNTPYYQLIICTNYSYSIHSYADHLCNQLISTKTINTSNCKEISVCINPTNVEATSPTAYFTTTTITPTKSCNFINTIGYNIPTEKCLTISSKESQKYECNEYGAIVWSYYSTSNNCEGNTLLTFPYPANMIHDWTCDSNTCINEQYMEIIVYRTENDCSVDAISDTHYDSHLYVVNTCMTTPHGGIMYKCTNNNNIEGISGGYTITKYLDSDCVIQDGDSMIYNEIECMQETKRRQHMIFCNGTNVIKIEKDDDYIMNCNYFIHHGIDPLGVVGEPLNECIPMQHGPLLYSKKYQCKADKSGIEEKVYHGQHCMDENIKFTLDRPEFTDFYCDSQYSCHSMMSDYNSVLIGKQYTNNTCAERNEEFWHYQHIIINQCWPIGPGLYAIISCDENGFVYHSLYNDKHCESLAFHQRFKIFDCIFGKLFETVYCPNWNEQTMIYTTQTSKTPIITSRSDETINTKILPIYNTNETDMDDMGRIENMAKQTKECVNMFGGRDIAGISCQYWADIIWALIVLVAGIIACFICWCWCSYDTKSIRRENSSLLQRKNSRIPIPTGNNNEDIQHIVIQQLNNGKVPNVMQQLDEDIEEKYDDPPFSL